MGIVRWPMGQLARAAGWLLDDQMVHKPPVGADRPMWFLVRLSLCPNLFPSNFNAFLEVYNMLQDGVLVEHDLSEDLQIAPFHPFFEFEGSGADGVDNYTNRSPYPIFHILR